MLARRAVGLAAVLASPWLPWLVLGACSSTDSGTLPFISEDAGGDTSNGFDAGPVSSGYDAGLTPIVFGDDANGNDLDAAPSSLCPGTAIPEDAATTACAIDTSASCPPCASWGFVCAPHTGPEMQGVHASSFCREIDLDGSALVCCTEPACIVSSTAGQCDASSATRYECNGGAVPQGACEWLGAGAPNDYCCQ